MRFLVVGHNGWLGSKIARALEAAGQDVVTPSRRIANAREAFEVVHEAAPDRLVCAAGRTHTASCSTIDGLEGAGAWSDLVLANQLLPLWLADAARAVRAPMLYLGTGCIFQYDDAHAPGGEPFYEDDAPNFFDSAYSRVKGATDALMQPPREGVLNARIRMPIDDADGPRDFVSKLLSYSRIASIPNSMTVLHDVLPALLALLHAGVTGTFNAVNPEALSHADVLRIYAQETGVRHAHTLVSGDELRATLAAGRSNNTLCADKLQDALAGVAPSVRLLYGAPERLPPLSEAVRVAAARRSRQPMRVLVTGGCGFIGSHLVNALLRDARVEALLNIDCLDACASESNVQPPRDGQGAAYELLRLDLGDADAVGALHAALFGHRTTHVMHLAAKTHVDASFDGTEALQYTRSNVQGTHNLVEAARRYAAGGGALTCVLHMSTDEVYGETMHGHVDERALIMPTNPYAATKAAAEFIVRSYGTSFGLPWKMVRCNNVYGPRQFPDKVIPKFAQLAARGAALTLHGDGSARRTFLHVSDVVAALLAVLLQGRLREVYNIGSGDEISISDLADLVVSFAEAELGTHPRTRRVPDRPFNDARYAIDDAKLRQLGWTPRVRLGDEGGLRDTLRQCAAAAPPP